ncbi:late expression factor 6 [Orgyia leucostigma nucleopolyhedrovirus]|uniref:Late expression factor 6 n=1 Tax=Orgyia leucostigma nucleopolyhedrovirus TaxID=490711 RepID=B0FDN6_9ABAC|nr:late expression factor 6 [Orgyia leucostigma nucleopolyhedrovirus]ABY65744.1 late expression factor 6 [Orgyia leucostigma nucleopolyhedrovirus]
MYTFSINGGAVDKWFARNFICHVCGGEIDGVERRVDWENCTRKRLVVTSRRLADTLQTLSGRVYWPDGRPFVCKLLAVNSARLTNYGKRQYGHRRHHQHRRRNMYSARTFNDNLSNTDTSVEYVVFKQKDSFENAGLSKDTTLNRDDVCHSDNNVERINDDPDWYTGGNFVDVELCHDDDDDNCTDIDFLRHEIDALNV